MNRHNYPLKHPPAAKAVFSLLLLVIFVTELEVMESFAPFFGGLDETWAGLIDSYILLLVCAPLLWFTVVRPMSNSILPEGKSAVVGPRFFLKVLAIIFAVEFLVMLLLPRLELPRDTEAFHLLDAALTTLVCAPLIWTIAFRPIPDSHWTALTYILSTPRKLFGLMLVAIFFIDFLEKVVLPHLLPFINFIGYDFADSLFTTVFAAPFLWWLVVQPLIRTAESEKARSDVIRTQVVDAIVTVDGRGEVESINPAAERLFGYRFAEIVRKPVASLFAEGAPDIAEILYPESASAASSPVSREVVCRGRNGETRIVELSVSRVFLEGRWQFVMIIRDISDRRAAEEALRESEIRFREIYEQSDDTILFFKPGSCSLIDTNRTVEKLYGFTRNEMIAGGMETVCPPEEQARLKGFICGIKNSSIHQLERIANRRKDGTEIIVSIQGKLITLQGVNLTYVTVRDITARIRVEEKTREIQAKLIQANKMTSLGLLVSGVAHEINNPNNYIMNNAQLLGRIWEDALKVLREYYRENGDFQVGGLPFSRMADDSSQLFAGITDGSRRINEIVNNLKKYARDEQGSREQGIDLNRVVTTAVNILRHQIAKYTENFRMELAEGLPPITGNSQQLVQVVINLLMNACQALPDKQRVIEVATGTDGEGRAVTISVRDEGVGMPADVGSRVLDPFFTTKLDSGGTGLGLTITHSIVKEHDGTLDFVSEPGKGTNFTVTIPTKEISSRETTP